MIDEQKLAEWEQLANEATEGPWCLVATETFGGKMLALRAEKTKDDARSGFGLCVSKSELANYEFIVAAREAVPALIAEVRELKSQLGSYVQKIAALEVTKERLSKEADWLAEQCQTLSGYSPILRQGLSKNQWREDAKKAVECVLDVHWR